MAAAEAWSATLAGGEHAEQISGLRVSEGMFEMLGVPPALGRTPSADEFRPGHANVVVLSYPLWQGRFGGDPARTRAGDHAEQRTSHRHRRDAAAVSLRSILGDHGANVGALGDRRTGGGSRRLIAAGVCQVEAGRKCCRSAG